MASSSVQNKSTSNAEGNGEVIKTVLIIGAIIVVVVFAIVMAVKSNSSNGIVAPVQVATSQDQANNAILTQLASKCKGNYSLLNAQDKAQADQIAHGRGAIAISVMYHK
jgi:parvulin-like peptidyl-prolyl isomerase